MRTETYNINSGRASNENLNSLEDGSGVNTKRNIDHVSKTQTSGEVKTKLNPANRKESNVSVAVEGIYVRKPNMLAPLETISSSDNGKVTFHSRKLSMQYKSPLRGKPLNLASIPDSIRTDAIINTSLTVGPRQKFRSISTKRGTETDSRMSSLKAKKIEDIETILNRVIRAKCCLQPQNPEQVEVMTRAVGDGSDYI